VGGFRKYPAVESARVFFRYHALQGGRNEDRAWNREKFITRNVHGAWEITHEFSTGDMTLQRGDVDPLWIRYGAVAIADAQDFHASLGHFGTCPRADVAEPLDHCRGVFGRNGELFERFHDREHHAAPGRFAPADAAANRNRLASHDFRAGITDLHAVG